MQLEHARLIDNSLPFKRILANKSRTHTQIHHSTKAHKGNLLDLFVWGAQNTAERRLNKIFKIMQRCGTALEQRPEWTVRSRGAHPGPRSATERHRWPRRLCAWAMNTFVIKCKWFVRRFTINGILVFCTLNVVRTSNAGKPRGMHGNAGRDAEIFAKGYYLLILKWIVSFGSYGIYHLMCNLFILLIYSLY